jgi:hypothetical protein
MKRRSGSVVATSFLVGILFVFCMLFAVVSPALAQSTATLRGTVTDPTGGGVPNARVTATNQATGVA